MKRVLVVEDDDAISVILEKRMHQRGYVTSRALDAKQATDIFRKNMDIILVLSDFDMGGGDLNGDALYKNIKDELVWRSVPFIIISAVIPQIITESFKETKVPIIEKWKLNKEFDVIITPLLVEAAAV